MEDKKKENTESETQDDGTTVPTSEMLELLRLWDKMTKEQRSALLKFMKSFEK